ncbi:MAG TPA: hypothetical protein VNG51_01870 [Ktedonobacteraceae bacterium]|nr:hypothetical protein [Ktedonobacteraceae bacterium]
MPLNNGGHWEERFFHDLSTLPLPGAAVVIDVREERSCDDHETPLIGYLAIELEDLAVEMRLNQVARWRYLADCFDLLRIETIPPDTKQDEFVDIKLITRAGRQTPIQGRNDLVKTIGRGYIDRVRNQHIKAMKDNGSNEEAFQMSSMVDPEQPTVRVFFLTDMEDKNSLARASTYASWLKDWVNEQHGVRSYSRDERISTIAICLNAPSNGQEAILQSLGGWTSDQSRLYTALDMVILLQEYRDDAAYIGGEEQIYQAELILYTLLLHWPEVLTTDGQGAWYDLDGIQDLPWPTYTIGIAAMEYSARWGARWLDYGLTARALELMRDVRKVDDELKALRFSVQGWFDAWWGAVKGAVPTILVGTTPDIEGLAQLENAARRSPFRSGSPLQAQSELQRFTSEVHQLYAPSGSVTLQRVIDSAPFILDQIRQNASDPGQKGMGQEKETATQLTALYIRAQQFIDDCFRGSWGAVPRALNQIAFLRESASELRRTKQDPPNIEAMRRQFEHEAADANKQLMHRTRSWKAPMVGEFLQSTALSLVFSLFLLIVLWSVSGNASFVPVILQRPLLPGITGLQVLCLVFVILVEVGYLVLRNNTLKKEQQAAYQKLRDILQQHCAAVGEFVAANTALTLLEWTDLYKSGEEISPYEERLKQLDKTLERAQIASRQQQHIADQRLRLSLDQKPLRNALEPLWPNLNNRKDLLTWRSIEDAYLSASSELEQNFPPLNFLSAMLVRRLGTEKAEAILQSLMPKALVAQGLVRETTVRSLLEVHEMHAPTKQSDEIRFQMLSTMLVGVLLSSDVVPPAIQDVLPLIESYSRQKDNYLSESSVLASDVLNLSDIVRETMLDHALRGDQAITNFTLKPDVSAEFVLASWMRQQNLFDTAFAEHLEENDIIALLDKRKVKLEQALDDLRQKSRLDGYPDQMTGDDFFLLLLAPGWSSDAFIVNSRPQNNGPNKVRPVLFPDAEKMVYLHIHRLRQLLPGTAVVVKY